MDHAKLRELAARATPGPWFHRNAGVRVNLPSGEIKLADCALKFYAPPHPDHAGGFNDAAYIAALDPATVIALLDEIEELRKLVDRYQGMILNE